MNEDQKRSRIIPYLYRCWFNAVGDRMDLEWRKQQNRIRYLARRLRW